MCKLRPEKSSELSSLENQVKFPFLWTFAIKRLIGLWLEKDCMIWQL